MTVKEKNVMAACCRVCGSKKSRLKTMAKELREIYVLLTSSVQQKHPRRLLVCYVCQAYLFQAYQLRLRGMRAKQHIQAMAAMGPSNKVKAPTLLPYAMRKILNVDINPNDYIKTEPKDHSDDVQVIEDNDKPDNGARNILDGVDNFLVNGVKLEEFKKELNLDPVVIIERIDLSGVNRNVDDTMETDEEDLTLEAATAPVLNGINIMGMDH